MFKLSDIRAKMLHHPHSAISIAVRGETTARTFSFAQVVADVDRLARWVRDVGVRDRQRIGIRGTNCYEWIVWDLALLELNAVSVAIPEEGFDASSSQLLTEFKLALLATSNTGDIEDPRIVPLSIDRATLDSLRVSPSGAQEADRDLFSLVFSSGTTGHLKGLSISRRGTELLIDRFTQDFSLRSTDAVLIFLPLSNYQQRVILYECAYEGASIHFCEPPEVFRALKVFRPTFVIAPPVFYDNVARLYRPNEDRGARLRAGLGGNIRLLITGMAPIRRQTLDAFNDHGVPLLQAYGVTEAGMIAWNTTAQHRVGTVGRPIWPDDLVLDEAGNIFVRREFPLTKGYFHDPRRDGEKVFLSDGTIATGDVGELDADGFLTLRGRAKDIVVTAGGKKFHPSEVEMQILASEGVLQAAIVQSRRSGALTAVVQLADSCSEGDAHQQLLELNERLAPFQRIEQFVFTTDAFTQANGCLTRNMKLNRAGVQRHFANQIDGPKEME